MTVELWVRRMTPVHINWYSTERPYIRLMHNILPGIPYTHIASPMPDIYRGRPAIPRGVANRRAAINWIRKNGKKPGVMYFGDDDNTFDLKLFDEIRYTTRVSMFPVGLIGQYAVSTPVVRDVSRKL